ncbi:hypothetical protein [Reyranella sp.]|uniref:hypothetical protein n=1 Tax=Reyranella sp. TaxID=1929291 RepID=UPI003D11E3D7
MKANDNKMSELQRIKALETIIAKLRTDLARVEVMHKLTPTNPRLKKQKGAIEKVLFLALVEISKLRKMAEGPQIPAD